MRLAKTQLSTLERLPKWCIIVPLTLQWLWLGVRYRDFMLPTLANPRITTGGLVGESKTEYWQAAGHIAHAFLTPTLVVNRKNIAQAEQLLRAAQIDFPIIVKPNLGLCGYGVRKVNNLAELQDYWQHFPQHEQLVIQPFLTAPGEAGLFYWRLPDSAHGELAGVALRYFPQVTGDGLHNIGQLIKQSPRLKRLWQSGHECTVDLQCIPQNGEIVRLATIGSTRVGGLYKNGKQYMTAQLAATVDAILQDIPEFYFGRLDVRFESLEQLERGEFKIIELNGAGAEAIEAWDPECSLVEAFKIIFRKQAKAFEIGAMNRQQGYQSASLWEVATLNWQQIGLNRQYPPSN